MQRIGVIGGGTMGSGIAHVFVQNGYHVTLVDVRQDILDRAMATIKTNLERQVKKGIISADDVRVVLMRLNTSLQLDALSTCDFIVEAATEEPSIKTTLFKDLDKLCKPDCVLATNTSSISITGIAAATKRPDKVIGMHFFNPVPVMSLVEIIRGLATSDATFNATMELAKKLGKTPVAVNDYPGFVSNRVLMPMINEAIYCLMEGVADREAIDTVMKLGMNHPMGPLALADFIGLDVCLHIMEVLHKQLGDDKYRPCPLLRKMVAAGHLGKKSGKGFYEHTK
jgi:3-hydroxybutyryl-CoA dehydrogenase